MKIEAEHEGHKFNWDIVIKPSSRPISEETIVCPFCQGSCRPHFGMIDDPVDCGHCKNTGSVSKPVKWEPKPPQDLVDSLHRVVREYWNGQQNEKFELTG